MPRYTVDASGVFVSPFTRRVCRVRVWGGGGGGGGGQDQATSVQGASGGSGGAYASGRLALQKDQRVVCTIGTGGDAGGPGATGGSGGLSSVGVPPIAVAPGGTGGSPHAYIEAPARVHVDHPPDARGVQTWGGGLGGESLGASSASAGAGGAAAGNRGGRGLDGLDAVSGIGGDGGLGVWGAGTGGRGADPHMANAQEGEVPGGGGGGGSGFAPPHQPLWAFKVSYTSANVHYLPGEVAYVPQSYPVPELDFVIDAFYTGRLASQHGFAQVWDDIRTLITFQPGTTFNRFVAFQNFQSPTPPPGGFTTRITVNSTVTAGGVPIQSGLRVEFNLSAAPGSIVESRGVMQVRDSLLHSSQLVRFRVRIRVG